MLNECLSRLEEVEASSLFQDLGNQSTTQEILITKIKKKKGYLIVYQNLIPTVSKALLVMSSPSGKMKKTN